MPAKAFFFVLALFLLSSSAGLSEDQKNQSKLSSSTKMKITNQLNESDRHSVSVFTKAGDETANIPLDTTRSTYFHSLRDYVVSVQSDEEKEGRSDTKLRTDAKPIATCKDPQALEPPPPCVICKDGRILCSKASFGTKVTMGEEEPQKLHPQEQ